MPYIDYIAIRERISIEDALERAGWPLIATWGVHGRGPCPIHRSGSPRSRVLRVHRGRRLWTCWKCGAHGDVVQLWAWLTDLDQYHAALDLCREFGVDPPTRWK